MKKKILLIIALLTFFPLTSVYAGDCTSTNISGQASSYATTSTGSGCSYVCWWNSTIGLRFRLYKYDGSTYTALGNGVDVWGFSSASNVYMSNARYSNPNNNAIALKTASDCSTKQTTGKMNLTSGQYDDHKIYMEGSLYNHFSNGTVDDYILNDNKTGGWLYSNLYGKLKADNDTKDAEIESLWGVSADTLRSNGDDIYVVVEVLIKVYTKSSTISGFQNGYFYFGTVSEFAPTLGYSSTYRALGIQSAPVGKMVNGLIKRSDMGALPSSFEAYGDGVSYNKAAACNNAYGMAIYHLTTDCEECGKSCDTECSDYTQGTTERRACAIKYCKTEESGNYSNCVNTCAPNPTGQTGCPTESGKCTEDKSKYTSNNCTGSGTVLTSKVCYDDTTVTTSNGSEENFSYEQLNFKYYRIMCDEKLDIFGVTSDVKVLELENKAANLHLGYSTTFSKTCKLEFKYKKANGTYDWTTTDDDKILIKKDIQTYKNYYNTYKNTNSSLAKIYEDAYKQLEDSYKRAKDRLALVTAMDSQDIETKAEVEIIDKGLTTTKEIDIEMKPIYCEEGDSTVKSGSTTSLKCTLNESKVHIKDDNSVVCGNDGEADVVINSTNGTAKYDYTVYYANESTWVSSYGDPNKVYYTDENGIGKEKCLTAVDTFNGYCTEVENAYRFEPFTVGIKNETSVQVVEGAYTIKITNYGSCGQFEFSCDDPYKLVDGKLCNKCMDYDPTSQEYLDCYKAYCSCDVICGANVACRAKYCPLECEGCEVGYTDITSTDDSCDTCVEKCNTDFSPAGGGGTNKNLSSNIVCRYDCCNASCDIANDTCRFDCCITKCNSLKEKNLLEYMGYKTTASMTALEACYQDCRCPNGNCGNDYYYRTINQEKPFPDRTPGANWYNKVEHITESENVNGRYYDPTNGKNSGYEYKISLTSEDIQKIKNDHKINTTYTQKMSSEDKANLDDRGVYCSYLLHDYLNNELNIRIEEGTDGKYGSGCANIG